MTLAVRTALTIGFLTLTGGVGCRPEEPRQASTQEDPSTVADRDETTVDDASKDALSDGVVDPEAADQEGGSVDPVAEPVFVEAKTQVDRYKNGKRRREFVQHIYLNAPPVWHGPFKEWHENGQLQKSGDYRNGSKVGTWNWWSDEGTLLKAGRYDTQGQLDGIWKFFRPDGTAERVESFSTGQKDGMWIWYDASGQRPVVREQFHEGKRHGLSQRWHPPQPDDKGKEPLVLLREVPYVDGHEHGEAMEYFPSGNKKVRVSYRNGRRHGKSIEWDNQGEQIAEHAYRDGERID